MRTKQIVAGLKNTQKIHVMVDGFGVYMQVKDVENIYTSTQRSAVYTALQLISAQKITGFAKKFTIYNRLMGEMESVNVQIDLV